MCVGRAPRKCQNPGPAGGNNIHHQKSVPGLPSPLRVGVSEMVLDFFFLLILLVARAPDHVAPEHTALLQIYANVCIGSNFEAYRHTDSPTYTHIQTKEEVVKLEKLLASPNVALDICCCHRISLCRAKGIAAGRKNSTHIGA